MRRVALLIPDAGPLISLGTTDALTLLLALELPIYVVDAVLAEVTGDLSLPGATAVRRFVDDHPRQVRVVETFVGTTAAAQRQAAPATRPRGLGEAAIAEFLARLDEFVDPKTPVLVLFEDSDVRRVNAVVRGDVHLLSTRALLVDMEQAGRRPSGVLVDQPSPGTQDGSAWLPQPGTRPSC